MARCLRWRLPWGVLWAVPLVAVFCSSAAAFWPLSRNRGAQPDSVAQQHWQQRFDTWKQRPLHPDSTSHSPKDSGAAAFTPITIISGKGHPPPSTPPTPSETAGGAGTTAAPADTVAASSTPAPPDAAGFDAPVAAPADSLPDGDATASDAGSIADPELAAPPPASPAEMAATAAAAADAGKGFAPVFNAKLTSDNDKMNFDSTFNVAFSDASGVTLSSNAGYREDLNLNQDTSTESRVFSNSLNFPLRRLGMSFQMSTSNNRRDVLGAPTITNTRNQTRSDSRNASLAALASRKLVEGAGVNASYARSFRFSGQNITATVGTSTGDRENRSNGSSYGVGMRFDRLAWLNLTARAGRAFDSNTDQTSSFITPENPLGEQESTSRGDSLNTTFRLAGGGWLPIFSGTFRATRSSRSFTDARRTSTGVTASTTDFVLETESRFGRTFQLQGSYKPWSRVGVDFTFEVGRDSVAYDLRDNAFSDTRRRRWGWKGNLKYASGGTLNFDYSTQSTEVNRDELNRPPNPQTREDRENRLTASIAQDWTKTLKTRAYGELRLTQGFYAHEGPQGLGDRDDFRTQVGLDVDGRINAKMRAGMKSYVRTFDQAFIDPRRSASSRNETEYVVRLDFHYTVTPKVNVSQLYGLSSKVIDEIFNPDRNTLNRNHYLQTTWTYAFNGRLSFNGNFNYLLQDTGAFLEDPTRRTSERFFSPTTETRKNDITVGASYAVLPGGKLTFSSSQRLTRDRRTTFFGGKISSVRITELGNLAMGLTSKFRLGDFQLDAQATRNQSFNATLNRDVFYNINSSLSYTF